MAFLKFLLTAILEISQHVYSKERKIKKIYINKNKNSQHDLYIVGLHDIHKILPLLSYTWVVSMAFLNELSRAECYRFINYLFYFILHISRAKNFHETRHTQVLFIFLS